MPEQLLEPTAPTEESNVEPAAPAYDPENPAPEQNTAKYEAANNIIRSIMDRIEERVPDLTREQLYEIGKEVNDGVYGLTDAIADIYGEPENPYASAFK